MINFYDGDITEVEYGMIVHCVNCQAKMGSGVAKALYKKWPSVKSTYLRYCKANKYLEFDTSALLGHMNRVEIKDGLAVANCFGQNFYGYDGGRYASVDALEESLHKAFAYCRLRNIEMIHAPYKMASDRAGLDWDFEVFPIIEKKSEEFSVDVTIWKK